MKWKIILFETARNEKPVENFIRILDPITQAKIVHKIDLLEKYGSLLGMPHTRKLTPNLYELRIRGKNEIRLIYVFMKNDIYLLHAFQKKTQKTPTKEIETAQIRRRVLTSI